MLPSLYCDLLQTMFQVTIIQGLFYVAEFSMVPWHRNLGERTKRHEIEGKDRTEQNRAEEKRKAKERRE